MRKCDTNKNEMNELEEKISSLNAKRQTLLVFNELIFSSSSFSSFFLVLHFSFIVLVLKTMLRSLFFFASWTSQMNSSSNTLQNSLNWSNCFQIELGCFDNSRCSISFLFIAFCFFASSRLSLYFWFAVWQGTISLLGI